MLDVIPFMVLVAVVVVLVAGWGVARERLATGGLQRLPEAEAALAACLREHGVTSMRFRVFRDPDDGSLVITGPDDLDPHLEAALGDCDRRLDPFRH